MRMVINVIARRMGQVHISGRGRAGERTRGERRGRGREVRRREGASLIDGWRERLEFLLLGG